MSPETMTELVELHFGVRANAVVRAERGRTNDSFFVASKAGRFVARASWPNKPRERLEREAAVLAQLGTPRLIPTIDGTPYAIDDGRAIHLFARIDGVELQMWQPDVALALEALVALDALHATLQAIPANGRPTEWLRERLDRARAFGVEHDTIRQIESLLDDADRRYAGRVQWLHGDFHLGNLVRTTGGLAVLDFDDTGTGSAALERGLACCAMSRRDDDDSFSLDATLWRATAGDEAIVPLFCASQVLVHLEASARGRWTLGAGIGYLGCLRTLTSAR